MKFNLFCIPCVFNSIMCVLNVTNQCFLMFSGIKYLNETNVTELINRRTGPDPYKDNNELLCALYQVFSTPEALGNSFIKRSQERKKDLLKSHNHAKTASLSMTKEKVSIIQVTIYSILNFII